MHNINKFITANMSHERHDDIVKAFASLPPEWMEKVVDRDAMNGVNREVVTNVARHVKHLENCILLESEQDARRALKSEQKAILAAAIPTGLSIAFVVILPVQSLRFRM